MATNPMRLDPTRTTGLRRRFTAEMRRRFMAVVKEIQQLLVKEDALGMIPNPKPTFNAEPQRWQFRTDEQKLTAFNGWLQGQVDQKILSVDGHKGEPWTNKYIDSAYKQGAMRAYIDTHKEALAQSADFYKGSQAEFLRQAFNQPERVSKLKLLYTRTYEDLRGVTAAMSQQMSRTLASGLANGYGPDKIAREMRNTITGISKNRAEVLARTETIYAHSEGQLDSFKDLGVEEVGVMAEWATAGDDRVCSRCEEMEGKVFSVAKSHGLIPLHPNCRCTWLPSLETEPTEKEEEKPEG